MDELRKIKNILEDEGLLTKKQLILSGLLIMIFEQFKKFSILRVENFLEEEFKYLFEKGKDQKFKAALKFFEKTNAITAEEFKEIHELRLLRNNIGHELLGILVDKRKNLIKEENIQTAINIYSKIARWWVREIELTTNHMFAEYMHNEMDSIELPEIILLKEVIKKSLN